RPHPRGRLDGPVSGQGPLALPNVRAPLMGSTEGRRPTIGWWIVVALGLLPSCARTAMPPADVVENDAPGPRTPVWRIPADSPSVSLGASNDPDYDLAPDVR